MQPWSYYVLVSIAPAAAVTLLNYARARKRAIVGSAFVREQLRASVVAGITVAILWSLWNYWKYQILDMRGVVAGLSWVVTMSLISWLVAGRRKLGVDPQD